MMGGFQEVDIGQEHLEIMTGNCAAIAEKLNLEGSPELKAVKVFEQVVAGKYFWFHLVNNSDGAEFSACVFQPLGGAVENLEISITEAGHTEARNPNN